jgi:hypothetical protein
MNALTKTLLLLQDQPKKCSDHRGGFDSVRSSMRIPLAITGLGSGRNLACALLVAINLSPVLVGPILTPVFAADRPTTEADCEKAEMIWKKQ